ncbi:dtw domain-containing protein 2 [Willisornis vidua]|uniref:Dtw domain-containing protein 2 n=1 Tax=Willisornis vidua TaxID=1566151 RepID=A0ABQ9D394_9PASS|nr:dtw domain-containing protein 2 [Willisornis vidua]
MKGYTPLRKDRPGSHSGGVAFYTTRQHLGCINLCLEVDDEHIKSLLVGIKEQINKHDNVVSVSYKSSDHGEKADEAFYRPLEAASKSQALVVGDFSHSDTCWRNNRAKHKQSRRFLESIDHNFLTQMVEEKTSNGELFDHILTNREGFVGDLKLGAALATIHGTMFNEP